MEPVVFVLVIAAALALALLSWWRGRRGGRAPDARAVSSAAPAEVELDLPAEPPEPHPFDRDWLLARSRDFDAAGWDDTPDAAAWDAGPAGAAGPGGADPGTVTPASEGGEPDVQPTFFDRSFLEARERERSAERRPDGDARG